jgi:hypothetical protein
MLDGMLMLVRVCSYGEQVTHVLLGLSCWSSPVRAVFSQSRIQIIDLIPKISRARVSFCLKNHKSNVDLNLVFSRARVDF